MNRPIAFFDVDETLIHIKSMFSFRKFYFRHLSETTWKEEEKKHQLEIERNIEAGADRGMVNALFYKAFANCEQGLFAKIADAWYREVRGGDDLFVPQTLQELYRHKEQGNAVAFVSGSAIEILSPLARELDVVHILATNLEIKNGLYTGNIIPPQVIGSGKRIMAKRLARQLQVELLRRK